jgi:PrcB C-terminal
MRTEVLFRSRAGLVVNGAAINILLLRSLTRLVAAKSRAVPLLLLALTGSVGYSTPRRPQGVTNPGRSVPVTRLVVTFGTNTTAIWNGWLSAGSRIVVRDREAWDGVWKKVFGPGPYPSSPPLPALPEIDFSREMLVVVGMGQKPSGGYMIVVNSARQLDNRIEVEVQSMSPCGLAPGILTSPIDIVRIPKTELPITFREVKRECK